MKTIIIINSFLWLLTALLIFSVSGYSKGKAIKKSGGETAAIQSLAKTGSPEIHGTVKFEEIFADSVAISRWTILNEDHSSHLGEPSVGEFVPMLEFVTGDVVNAETPGTFFWASNFSNAFGKLLDEWLISPPLPTVELGDTLYFYGGSPGEADHDSIQVRLAVSDPRDTTTAFVHNLGRFKMDGPMGGWTLYKVGLDIPEAIGKPVWIALRYWHTNGGAFGDFSDNVWIDHVTVVNNPVTGIGDEPGAAPRVFRLEQNYPNPFNPETTISYQLSAVSNVRLVIYNTLGQKVKTLVSERQPAGVFSVEWDGRDDRGRVVPGGVYFYRLTVDGSKTLAQTRKMILMK